MSAFRNGTDASSRPDAAPGAPGALTVREADPRAQNGRRTVVLSRDRVTIDRTVRDVAMRVAVPMTCYRGVCVALKPAADGRSFYELRLDHRDPELCVTLGSAPDDRTIWSDWRAWSRYFALPATVERNAGPQPWPILDAGTRPETHATPPAQRRVRRRRRRPGLVEKRVARADLTMMVHREREIIARD